MDTGTGGTGTGIHTATGHFGKFAATAKLVLDTAVSTVRYQYRYRTLRYVRYDMDTGTAGAGMDVCTGHVGKFGKT